ncbi:Panacea domain-containing protein [Bifidobacterium oedipodis]|uniref:Antitoxin SocA-like Panacea domain-containing protein n=1 Tax=Bifidobacterium oedipodis TaxID=2675322 RepID=A0A7Y0HS77_9BIFI|nr:type II toxin-antitoxin system antitoxin SocA domain-containing protein [Bifidobacterium sp. DSM 109957]NMM93303.1 hypothetical protein [Bifidobacterium sp. DSM 109957]
MPDVLDVANFFISAAESEGEDGEGVSNLKLQKLLYFAQIASLQETRAPLFDDDFEAWDYGPVVPSVYRTFKANHGEPIRVTYGPFDHTKFTAEQYDLLNRVYRQYRQYSAYGLANMTHQPGLPWSECREHGVSVMDVEMLRQWAQTHDPVVQRAGRRHPKRVKYIPSSDGHTRLPAEFMED